MARIVRKKQATRSVPRGRIYIRSSFNNTIITATDADGGTIAWVSAGNLGFVGARKATPYAAQSAMKELIDRLRNFGVKQVDVFVSGVGSGREQAIRAFTGSDIAVSNIKDITPVPHNGVRPKKPRKV